MPKARPQPRKFGLRSSSHHTASDSGATSKRNLEKIDRSSAENTSKPTNGQPPVAGTILVDPPVDPAPDDNQLAASNAPAAELKPETPTTMAVPISQSADNADPLATSGAATKPVPSFQGTPEVMDPHGDLIIVTGNSDVGLFQVTVLTNKYNMAVSLRPFWRDWYSSLPPLDEYESPEALIHALLIAWEIGERDGYIKWTPIFTVPGTTTSTKMCIFAPCTYSIVSHLPAAF
ncbi:hypothetical protein B0T19DRAFT_395116 [Cercophora scortea]|uniref:Uncharacterized protein n=1 Tax=Cercophora scortea TaxID=314031 RepID=A0AAE0J1N5_9PEZI|nr:hypothetical protein B0T19DRAFT_395116 [Cercophora scortea]